MTIEFAVSKTQTPSWKQASGKLNALNTERRGKTSMFDSFTFFVTLLLRVKIIMAFWFHVHYIIGMCHG